jgi:Protein of unknown function (DUF3485)
MLRTVLLAIVAVLVACEGYVHGLWTNRWSNPRALEEAVAKLQAVPIKVGDWQAENKELETRIVKQAGYAGYLLRTYRRPDGAAVNVMLACGPAGPLSVHTPDICYGGAGYTLDGEVTRQAFDAKESAAAEFCKARFTKPGALVPLALRVFYSWHVDHGWTAPANPRLAFAGRPAIYKMYVTYPLTASDERHDDAACAEFMAQFLPELERTFSLP